MQAEVRHIKCIEGHLGKCTHPKSLGAKGQKLRRLKLQGQNLPESVRLRHYEKLVFMGDSKTRRQKIKHKSINWTIVMIFQENRLPRKLIYLPKYALLFLESHDVFFLLPLMLSYENIH